MTQERLASRLEISRASLANIEIGRQRILVHQLYSIAQAIGLQPSDLLPPFNREPMNETTDLPLPEGLKAAHKEQIRRFFDDAHSEPTARKES